MKNNTVYYSVRCDLFYQIFADLNTADEIFIAGVTTPREPPAVLKKPKAVFGFQIPNFFPALVWRLKSRRNKKRIATAVCKWRDESNEPN